MSDSVLRSMMEGDSPRHREVMQTIRESSDRTDSKIDALRDVVNELAIQTVQLNAAVKQTSINIDKLGSKIESLESSVREDRNTVAELVALANRQAETAAKQQEMVKKLLIRN